LGKVKQGGDQPLANHLYQWRGLAILANTLYTIDVEG
jgi:hypothetical protein